MAKEILVPLRNGDRIEEVIPYLDKVAHTDTRVLFLIHRPGSGFKWLQAYCGIAECGLDHALLVRRMMESYSVQQQRRLAEQKVFQTCRALHRLGAKIAVELYTGGITKTLDRHLRNERGQLVLMRSGAGQRIGALLRKIISGCGFLRKPAFESVLLFYPG